MAKFHGVIGYGEAVETAPGVWEDEITERLYFGDVIRNTRQIQEVGINDDISVGNSISIVADAYAQEHFFAMRYCIWLGIYWVVRDVEVRRPRLVLRLGGVYNGPKAGSSDDSGEPAGQQPSALPAP
jgi:hypothetical protein